MQKQHQKYVASDGLRIRKNNKYNRMSLTSFFSAESPSLTAIDYVQINEVIPSLSLFEQLVYESEHPQLTEQSVQERENDEEMRGNIQEECQWREIQKMSPCCGCKKSSCTKNYCGCFKNKKKCIVECSCPNCSNQSQPAFICKVEDFWMISDMLPR